MKKSRRKFIKRIYNSVDLDMQQEIKEEFPKLFETKLVVGKWYWVYFLNSVLLAPYLGKYGYRVTYGFNAVSDWCNNSISLHKDYKYTPATDKEIERVFIKEVKKRGFKEGVKFINLDSGVVQTIKKSPYFDGGNIHVSSPKEEWSTVYKGGSSNPVIFKNGKWATIISTITKEQAEKELGKTIICD